MICILWEKYTYLINISGHYQNMCMVTQNYDKTSLQISLWVIYKFFQVIHFSLLKKQQDKFVHVKDISVLKACDTLCQKPWQQWIINDVFVDGAVFKCDVLRYGVN